MLKTLLLGFIPLVLTAAVVCQREYAAYATPLPVSTSTEPLPPDAGDTASTSPAQAQATRTVAHTAQADTDDTKNSATDSTNAAADAPVRLVIPSISLNDPVDRVGVNQKGEMDVPSGKTSHVGWYEYGTVPGDVGSSVIDAHVFAAFAKLNELRPGSSIYVQMQSGKTLRFVVAQTQTYPLAQVPADTLFNRADARRLNLITCAGSLTPDHSTYDHRLVIYAVLGS